MKCFLSFLVSFLLFSSLFCQKTDSILLENRFDFQYKKTYVALGLMVAGVAINGNGSESLKNEVVEERNEHIFGFENHADDYLQFSPFVAIYGFELLGMKPKTDWKNRTEILIKGQFLNLGLVYVLKKTINQTRPDGTAYSFPSGHTANVFAGATMLSIEYGDHHKWVPYAAYSVASTIGVMRIANNKHYISDVLFGAGLGILSIKTAYWTHHYQWNKTKSTKDPMVVLYKRNNF